MEAIETIKQPGVSYLALAAIIAKAARMGRSYPKQKWQIYEIAKRDINRLKPTADEYEAAIRLLTGALKI